MAVIAGHAVAQVPRTGEQEEQRRHSQEVLQEQQELRIAPRVELGPPLSAGLRGFELPKEAACIHIKKFLLMVPNQLSDELKQAGASRLPQDPLRFAQDFLDSFNDRCVGQRGVDEIVKHLTAELLVRGYTTTRLSVPEQDAGAGTFNIWVIPGTVNSIRFEDEEVRGTLFNIFPSARKQLLNLREIEQGLEQMKRVPSQEVDIKLLPGAQPGESDILVVVKRTKPWRLSVSLDDSGSKATGKLQAGGTASVDNPLGISDLFSAGFTSDAGNNEGRGSRSKNINYSFPFRDWTVGLSASTSHYYQRIAGIHQTFVSSGASDSADLKATYTFHRGQSFTPGVNSKSSISLKLGKKISHSFIDDAEIGVQYRNLAPLEISLNHKQYFGRIQADFGFSYQKNLRADYTYEMKMVDLGIVVPFAVAGIESKYVGAFHGQFTHYPLRAAQWTSIGGRSSVRGFDGETTLAAEQGVYLRNEIETPLGQSGQALYAALDFGKVSGPSVQFLLGDSLTGALIGIRGTWTGLQYDVFAGKPIKQPHGFPEAKLNFGFSVAYQY